MKRSCLKKWASVILVIAMLCFSSIIMTGCGDDYDDYDDYDSNYDTDYDSSYDTDYDSGYDDWDTDNNGEADWHDVDTDNDGNVSEGEMNDYLDDWEEEENNESNQSGGNSIGGFVPIQGN